MVYASASQSGYGGNTAVIRTDAPQADVVSISDAELLFTGHLERKGPDLILTGHDGRHHIVPGYFSAEHLADLVAPSGARITGDLVNLLAGSPAPGQYAQAQATVATDAIGRIEKVVGDVTVMRNGAAVALHVGDAVYKNDVVQTGTDSSCGIGFPDGTALNLVANTRMALNDYVYDPNGSSNDALFNLVQGGFAFVAGKVAHTGDMKIGTPVATMGIRGTTGYALEQVAAINANAGNVTMSFAVVADPGSDRVGQYDLIDQFGNVVAQVGRAGIWTNVQFQGPNLSPTVTTQPMTAANFAIEQALVPALVQILNNINNLNPNPQSGPNNPGSSTPPLFELINFQQNFQQNGAQQQTVNVQLGGSNGQSALTATFVITPGTPGTAAATSTVIWTSPVSGTWETGANWNDSIPPSAPEYVNINEPVKVTVEGTESADGLRIASGAILNIASGATLEVSQGIADFGTLQINSSGSDPTLAINGTVYLLNGGKLALVGPTDQNLIIGVAGTGATLVNVNNTIIGSGTIGQGDGALSLINGKNGTIEAKPLGATDSGRLVIDTGHRVSNSGLMTAAGGGTLQVADNVTNFGLIQALAGGTIVLADIVANSGTIGASGPHSIVNLDAAHISGGTLGTDTGGLIETLAGTSSFSNVMIAGGSFIDAGTDAVLRLKGTTSLDGTVTLEGAGTFKLEGAHAEITGKGLRPVELDNGGTVSGAGNIGGGDQHFVLVNERSGTIDAGGQRALVIDNNSPDITGIQPGNAIINTGTIEATGAGGLTVENTTIVDATDAAHDTGLIEAATGSRILLENATIIDGTVNIPGVLVSTGTSAIIDAIVDNTGTIRSTDGTFTVNATSLTNAGTLTATGGSTFTLTADSLANDSGAKIVAAGASNFAVTDTGSTNLGVYEAVDHSILTLNHDGTSINQVGGIIEAIDATIILNDNLGDANYGTIDAIDHGTIYLNVADSNATQQGGNHGLIEVLSGSGFNVTGDFLNWSGANVAAGGAHSQIDFNSGAAVINDGTITAADHGEVLFQDLSLATNAGGIQATSDGIIEFVDTTVNNEGGTIAAFDAGASVQLSRAQIDGGSLSIGAGNEFEIVASSEISNATISGGGQVMIDSDQMLTLDAVMLNGATISGGTDDLDCATSTVGADSTIQLATLQNGALTVAPGQTLTLNGLVLDSVTLSGGTDDLADAFSQINSDSVVKDATLQDGTLAVASGQTLTLDGVALGNVTLSGGTDDLHGVFSAVTTDSEIESATLENGKLAVTPGQTLILRGVTLDNVTLLGGVDDLDRDSHQSASSSLVSVDSTVQDATLQDGTLVVASGQTLTLDCVTLDNLVLFGGTVDLDHATSLVSSDIAMEYVTLQNGMLAVASDQTLTLDSVALDCVTLSGGTVDLDGVTSQVNGYSTIENATLQNGTLTVASAHMLTLYEVSLDNFTLSGGVVDLDGAVSAINTDSSIEYAILQDGTLTGASGQILTLDDVTVDSVTLSGGIDNLDSATLTVIADSTIENAILRDGTMTVAFGQTLTLNSVTLDNVILSDGTYDLNGATSTVSADSTVQYALLQDGTLAVSPGQTLTLDGVTLDSVTMVDHGAINISGVNSSGIVTLDDGTTISGDSGGTLTINSGSTLSVAIGEGGPGQGVSLESINFINNGTLDINGATLSVASTATVFGSGEVIISGGGTAEFHDSFDENVTFSGAGTLELAHSYTGTISGFGQGDTTDLIDVGYSPAEYAVWTQTNNANGGTGALQIYSGDTLEETLHLNGTYTPNEFALTQDNTPSQGTDINLSFISFSSDTPNTNGSYTPQISNSGSTLTLTNGGHNEYGSWFESAPQAIDSFTASFDYRATDNGQEPLADGMAFVLQESGASALGGPVSDYGGSGLGYAGIAGQSAAVEFNVYMGHVEGTNFAIDGSTGTYNPTGGVDLANPADPFASGDEIQVALTYNGSTLTETLTDLDNGAIYSTSYADNIPAILSAGTAYVGFTTGTGAYASTQTVSNFNFESDPTVYWAGAPGDDWTTANDWTASGGITFGTPNYSNHVIVGESGAYTLTITSADAANSLTIATAGGGADVQDKVGGSLAITGALTIDAGSFSLMGGSLTVGSIYLGSAGHFIGEGAVSAPIDNDGGFVEAFGNLTLSGAVTGVGTFQIDYGNTLTFGSSVAAGTAVAFSGSTGALQLDAAAGADLNISGFTGTAPDPAHSDVIELAGSWTTTSSLTGAGGNLAVNLTDGSETATLTFDNFSETLNISNNGADTFIFDPPAKSAGASVSVDNDTFGFHPGMGTETATNFNPKADTVELDHFANIEAVKQLTSLTTADSEGSVVIGLGHHDSVTLAGGSANYLQAHLHSLVHLS